MQRILNAALVALTLVVPIFATISPAGALITVSDDQLEIAQDFEGVAFPPTPWQVRNETNIFYLFSGAGSGDFLGSDAPFCGAVPLPNGGDACGTLPVAPGDVNTLQPTGGAFFEGAYLAGNQQATITIGGGIEGAWLFEMNPNINAQDNFTIQRFSATIFGEPIETAFLRLDVYRRDSTQQCDEILESESGLPQGAESTPFVTGFEQSQGLRFARLDLRPSNNYDYITGVGVGSGANVAYVGSTDLGITPFRLAQDESICFRLYWVEGAGTGAKNFAGRIFVGEAGRASNIQVHGDAARVAVWSEDRFGDVENAFPAADLASTVDRRVTVNAVVAEAYGNNIDNALNADSDDSNFDTLDQNKMRVWIRDMTPGSPTQNKLLCLDQGFGIQCQDAPGSDPWFGKYVRCCSSDATQIEERPIQYDVWLPDGPGHAMAKFEYTIVYGPAVPAGIYRIEFHESNKNWRVFHTFTIGNTGYTFDFLEGEPTDALKEKSTHVVGLGEPTEYRLRLTNTGVMTDTYGVTVPTPGNGWSATVTPSVFTLPPGAYQDVTVLVTPPAPNDQFGHAGVKKVIHVQAVSINDNSIKTRFLETILTASIEFGVDIMKPVTLDTVELRPGKSQVLPLTVRNTGTVQGDFVLTTTGTPVTELDSIAQDPWFVNMIPAYMHIFAQSQDETLLRIEAPNEAKPGDSFTLFVRATLSLNETIHDIVEIPVIVRVIDDFKSVVYCHGSNQDFTDLSNPEDQPFFTPATFASRCTINSRLNGGDWFGNSIEDLIFTELEDELFDDAYIFRVHVKNDGDRVDTFQIKGSWTPPTTDTEDEHDCEPPYFPGATDQRNGVPDGWRYRLLDDIAATDFFDPLGRLQSFDTAFDAAAELGVGAFQPNTASHSATTWGFSGERDMGRLTLQPGEEFDLFVEVKWHEPVPESGNGNECTNAPPDQYKFEQPALNAELRLSLRSENDPVLRQVQYLGVRTTDDFDINEQGRAPGNLIRPSVDAALGLAQKPEGSSLADGNTIYSFRAVNTGIEFDTLRMRVDVGKNGWVHEIVDYQLIPAPPSENMHPTVGNMATIRQCFEKTEGGVVTQLNCRRVGINDEVHVDVRVIPPSSARIGDKDVMDFFVSSGNDVTNCPECATGNITDFERVVTTVRGTFFFETENLAKEREAFPGQIVRFPFSVRNSGAENDVMQMSVLVGDPTWLPALGTGPLVGIPAAKAHHGYLGVVVPDDLAETEGCGDVSKLFRIKIESTRSPKPRQAEALDFFVNVDPCSEAPFDVRSTTVTVPSPGFATVDVTAEDEAGIYESARFSVVPTQLPRLYNFQCVEPPDLAGTDPDDNCNPATPYRDFRTFTPSRLSIANFHLFAPAGELSSSRIVLPMKVQADPEDGPVVFHDAVVNLATLYGFTLSAEDATQTIGRGTGLKATFNVDVTNTGPTAVSVKMEASTMPPGWVLSSIQNTPAIPPGQSFTVPVTVEMSKTAVAKPGDVFNFLVIGTSIEDPTKVVTYKLRLVVGDPSVQVIAQGQGLPGCPTSGASSTSRACVSPLETAEFLLAVTNAPEHPERPGITDYIDLEIKLPTAFTDVVTVEWLQGCDSTVLDPNVVAANICRIGGPVVPGQFQNLFAIGETRFAVVGITLPEATTPVTKVPVTVVARSGFSPIISHQSNVVIEVLDYRLNDIDQDGLPEYAVDADGEAENGYEEFRENLGIPQAGVQTQLADLERYLSDDARERFTKDIIDPETGNTTKMFSYEIDVHGCAPEGDGFRDHFLDDNADGLPDVLWMPLPSNQFQELAFTKDVTKDGVREYFFDGFDGDGRLDGFFDIVEGEFGCLLQFFFNEDNIIDYVVDLNRNGKPDDGEPVLIGAAPDGLRISSVVQLADMNGDGCLDAVVDTDADGDPDHFNPGDKNNGCRIKESSIKIVLRDVTGDGKADWTYASKGEGKPDSYYDPLSGNSGFIDTRGAFERELQEYWYLGALFAFVLVLFILLVAVTRR